MGVGKGQWPPPLFGSNLTAGLSRHSLSLVPNREIEGDYIQISSFFIVLRIDMALGRQSRRQRWLFRPKVKYVPANEENRYVWVGVRTRGCIQGDKEGGCRQGRVRRGARAENRAGG